MITLNFVSMKNRIELAQYFNELGFKKGAEIGVYDGHYAEILCKNIPGLNLAAVDCWQVYPGYPDRKLQSSMDAAYERAAKRLAAYRCHLIKAFSAPASRMFGDESLDFVYIDGNHRYEFVQEDLILWGAKVRKGGIIAGHDYYITPQGKVGVIKAVDEYVVEHGYELHIIDWDSENPVTDDRQPSWYFVKEN